MRRGEAKEYRLKIEKASASITDDSTALDVIELFPLYKVNHAYKVGDRFQEQNKLYRVKQPHTSQADWKPAELPALYALVSIEEWPEWIQPSGAHDVYPVDAKVKHNGKKWISTVPNNSWEPGVYGWDEFNS